MRMPLETPDPPRVRASARLPSILSTRMDTVAFRRFHRGQRNRIIVRNDHACLTADCGKKLPALARLRLDIGIIQSWRICQLPCIVAHALQDESVVPVRIPAATTGENFNDHKRPFQFPGPADRTLDREVPPCAPCRCHPVDDVGAIHLRWLLVRHAEAK